LKWQGISYVEKRGGLLEFFKWDPGWPVGTTIAHGGRAPWVDHGNEAVLAWPGYLSNKHHGLHPVVIPMARNDPFCSLFTRKDAHLCTSSSLYLLSYPKRCLFRQFQPSINRGRSGTITSMEITASDCST